MAGGIGGAAADRRESPRCPSICRWLAGLAAAHGVCAFGMADGAIGAALPHLDAALTSFSLSQLVGRAQQHSKLVAFGCG